MALSNAERQRRFKERRRKAEEAELRERWAREDKVGQETRKAETKVIAERQAIRAGVEPIDVNKRFRDREGNLHDTREILFMDTWDAALEDERQAQAEADGTWPMHPTVKAFEV
jgi:hypothetical protein